MRILATFIFITFTILGIYGQDLVAWVPMTNNLTEGQSLVHINLGIEAVIRVLGNSGDGTSNFQVNVYDENQHLYRTVRWDSPILQSGVATGWRVEFIALTGLGNSCTDGGKDHFRIEDDLNNIYDNPDHCVKLGSLPITYQHQPSAKLQNNQTTINWSVASQLNNEKYIIEHSKDGRSFSPIGKITGDGTSNVIEHYEHIHTSPSIGINYYRIKQVDYDGQYSYSDIASVRYDGDSNLSIYPNPTTSDVTIKVPAATTLRIMDVYGKLYTLKDISEGQNTINLSELPTGILIFAVGDQRFKVLKE